MEFIDGVNYVSDVMGFPAIIVWINIAICVITFVNALVILWLPENAKENTKYKKVIELFYIASIIVPLCGTAVIFNLLFDPFKLKIPTGEYKVSISSDVNMEEFIDTYEIIEYDDNDRTFTIKVRE